MRKAILLLGPTGSGKTPLGELMEARGLGGRPCVHFDFGAQLRACAEGAEAVEFLTEPERAFLREVIGKGALLEDRDFPIALRMLRAFLSARGVGPEAVVVLNGLPRHEGQARAMDSVTEIELVVHLVCGPETVLRRIGADTGGDRSGRADDRPGQIRRRIELYDRRTAPLLDHYRRRGVPVLDVAVGPETTAREMLEAVALGAEGGEAPGPRG